MAGARVNNYSPSTVDFTSLMDTVAAQFSGLNLINLTNISTTAVPAIASGSVVEVAGNLFRFSSEEAISTAGVTSTVNMTYGIRLVPSSSQCTAQFSSNSPTWISSNNGWYSSLGSSDRIAGVVDFINSQYHNKYILADYKYYGILSSGTPLGCKQLTFSMSSGSSVASSTHFIANARTNHRIVDARSFTGGLSIDAFGESSLYNQIVYMSFDDSTFQVTQVSTGEAAKTIYTYVTFKLI